MPAKESYIRAFLPSDQNYVYHTAQFLLKASSKLKHSNCSQLENHLKYKLNIKQSSTEAIKTYVSMPCTQTQKPTSRSSSYLFFSTQKCSFRVEYKMARAVNQHILTKSGALSIRSHTSWCMFKFTFLCLDISFVKSGQ